MSNNEWETSISGVKGLLYVVLFYLAKMNDHSLLSELFLYMAIGMAIGTVVIALWRLVKEGIRGKIRGYKVIIKKEINDE